MLRLFDETTSGQERGRWTWISREKKREEVQPWMLAIEAENLAKRFGSLTAVDGVTFSVREGEVFGFLRPNGVGKTTTVRMLLLASSRRPAA